MMTLKMSVNSMMVLSPQQGFVHTWLNRKVCGPRHTEARDQTPEVCVDCCSTITKLRR
jgi:hypothetical protein